MSFTNIEQGDDWELGDAIPIPVDLDDDPDTVITDGQPENVSDSSSDSRDDDTADG